VSHLKNKRDLNENAILELWALMGCVWIPQPRENGFDGVLCRSGKIWIVEIKNGNKPPSARKLTVGELKRKAQLEAIGVRYNVIENEHQAVELVSTSHVTNATSTNG